MYKDDKKILDFSEIIDSSFQAAKVAPFQMETAGMRFYRQVVGEKVPFQVTPQEEYLRLVFRCRDMVQSITSDYGSDSPPGAETDQLLALEEELSLANQALLKRFAEIELSLKDGRYPLDKIDRHSEMVERHSIAADHLSSLLANLRIAYAAGGESDLESLLEGLRQYFIDNIFQHDPPLLNSQPLPVMMEVKKAPIVEDQLPSAIPYPTISKDVPDPADLDSTIDVQFTDDVIAMADSLNNSPVEMYNFVRDNFEFEPYLGSRKGSQQTLTHRRGNDYDQASLLIALLRVSGIPARYATGTIKMTIDQATNWLGIDHKINAASILATAGMEAVIYIVGSDTVAISCRRVWVEAWVPFINYRGAINDSTGFMWVPMDPTFKQYSYQTGINLPAEIGFDAEAFVNDYISTFHSETPIEMFREMLVDSLAVYHPEADYEDLITMRSVIKETDGILPGTLPYTLMSMDSTFSGIASAKRYYIEFHLYDGAGMDLDYTISLPEIAEKQVTISYVGATAADQEIIDTSGGIFNVDLPYLVDLKPVLKIDGCEVALATGEVMMGTTHYSDMHFTAPTGASNQIPTVSNGIIAGNYQGIGIDTEDAFPSFWDVPETSCDEEYLGQEVHQTALTYVNNVDVAGDELSDLMHQVVINDVSEAIVGNTIRVLFSGGLPVSFEWTGMIVDADRKIIGPFSVDGLDNACDYMRLGGADGSIQENVLFETRFEEEAISAVKILELASDSGITICEVTTSIAADCPGIDQPSHVITAINNALAQGRHVIIPERGFTYYNWTGTGWINIDPATCAAGYIISGGQNGGATVQDWSAELQAMLTSGTICIEPQGPITVTPAPDVPGDLYCAENTANWEFTVSTIKGWGLDEDDNCTQTTTLSNKKFKVTNYTIKELADDPKFGAGEYVFKVGSPTDPYGCGCTMIEKRVTIFKVELAKVGETIVEAGNNYSENTKLRATLKPASVSGLKARFLEQTTSYYDGQDGATDLTDDNVCVVTIAGGIAELTIKSVSNSSVNAGPPDASIKVDLLNASDNVVCGSEALAVDQWVDEDSDGMIDWLREECEDILAHFQGIAGIVGDVADAVTGITQLNGDCGATPLGSSVIQISPTCSFHPNHHRLNVNNDLSAVIIHEARHAWQSSLRNAALGVDDDGNAATPRNDDDRDWLPEDTPAGSEADDIEDATAGSGDNTFDSWSVAGAARQTDAVDFHTAHKND